MSVRNLDSPEQLWELFEKYINQREWITVTQPHVKLGTVDIKVREPMTMEGFKCFLWDVGIGDIKRYIDNSDGHFNNYVPIITRIKEKIFKNNFGYASVNVYKENLIARQLGLVDKNQTNISVEQPLFNDVPKNDSDKSSTES